MVGSAGQRVLLAAAAALLGFTLFALLHGPAPVAVPVADDPRLDLRIDLNRATAAELEALPAIGPALAARIVAHREVHGPFVSLEDLKAVPGVGDAVLAKLGPYVTLGVDRLRGPVAPHPVGAH